MIRKANLNDAEAIARVHVESWHETYKALVPEAVLESRTNYEGRLKMWRQFLVDESLITLAAIEEEKIVGFVNGGKARDEIEGYDGELYALYLLKDHQGKGLGRQLVQAFAKELRERSFQTFYLWVLHNNEPAQRFYVHLGGKRVSEKNFETEVGPIVEIAYGWSDLEILKV